MSMVETIQSYESTAFGLKRIHHRVMAEHWGNLSVKLVDSYQGNSFAIFWARLYARRAAHHAFKALGMKAEDGYEV